MARTAVLGFPRIGADRELKVALEAGPTPDGGFRLRAVVPDGPAATGSAVCGGPTRPASGDAGRPPSAGPGGADERSASGCGDLAPSAVEAAGTVPG